MAEKLLAGGWEKFGDTYRVFAVIPSLPDGSANVAVLNATLLALTRLNPAAFMPDPVPPLPHHATEAPMPPAVEELIARSEDDDGPDGLKAGEAYREAAE